MPDPVTNRVSNPAAAAGASLTISMRSLLIAAVVCVTAFAAWNASADRSVVERAPTVGLVDVEQVINGSVELTNFNSRLEVDVNGMQVELDSLLEQLKSMGEDYNELPVSDREGRGTIRKNMFEVEQRAKVRKLILQNDIDVRKGEEVNNVYEKMLAAIETISARDGIEVVLFDDRAIQIPDGLVEGDVNRLVQARRVLYGSESVDLTARVLALLNENFAAGR